MNSKKKLLSLVTALAISASAFTGLVIPANAANTDNDPAVELFAATPVVYEIPAAGTALKADTSLLDNTDVTVKITQDATTVATTDSSFQAATYPNNISFRAAGTVSSHLADWSSTIKDAHVSVVVTPKKDITFTSYIGINATKSIRIWDNTDNKEVKKQDTTAKGVEAVTQDLTAGHEYLVYTSGTTACLLKLEYTVKGADTPAEATTAPTNEPAETTAPAETADPDATEVPAATDAPDATQAPAETADPNATEAPAQTDAPEVTTAPTATPGPQFEEPKTYYALDFEDTSKTYIDNTIKTTSKGEEEVFVMTPEVWDSEYYTAGMLTETSKDEKIGRYFKYNNNMTARKGTRCASMVLPDDAAKTYNDMAVVEFDFQFSKTGGAKQVVLIGNDTKPIQNGPYNATQKPAGTAAILKLDQPEDGEFTLNESSDAAATSKGYTGGTWAHVKAVMNFSSKTVIVTITSLDGATTFVEEIQVAMDAGAKELSQLFVCAPSSPSGYVCMDNIVVRSAQKADMGATYYTVRTDVDGKEVVLSAKEGESLKELPDTAKTGYIFDGWAKDGDEKNLLTDEQVLAIKLSADMTLKAIYHRDPEYIEPMVALEFSEFPEGGFPAAGADENTAASNPITVKIIGEIGGNLTEEPDERVKDLDVKWEFLGFKHIASKAMAGENPATADGGENKYCDSYAEVVPGEKKTSVDFQLKSQAFNFYGVVKATVTYGGKTMTLTKQMSILPDKATDASTILPKAGYKYVMDANNYSDDLIGYQLTTSGNNKEATDIVSGDWAAYGGNSGRGLYIAKDEETNKKIMKLKSTGTNSSSFAVNKLGSAPTGQVIIRQDVKFYNSGSSLLFKQDNPVTWSANATALSFDFNGSGFVINGSDKICDASAGKWYTIVLAADVTSKLAYAKVYDKETGDLLGSSDIMPFVNAGATAPVYLCYRTPDNAQGELDFNNVSMYVPQIDGSKFTVKSADETISIPKAGKPDVSTTITASALSSEGLDMIGAAEWSFDGVSDTSSLVLTPDKTNSQIATLTVKAGAPAGDLKVNVKIGGVTKQVVINLTSSQDNVQFTKSTSSISIPLEEGITDTYEYAAKVVGPKSEEDETPMDLDKTVTLAVYDKNNVNPVTTMPAGITFDAATGKLTVSSTAKACVLYVRATSTNRKDETITKAVKVTIHGLAFDFGSDGDDAVVEGYTAVTPNTVYSNESGYGLESGSPTVDGTASIDNADSDSLKGAFKFKAKVIPAKVYKVKINYSGNVVSEAVNADLTGVALANSSKSTAEYTIPVIDDVLDLSFSGGSVASIVIEKTEDKKPNLKPHIYTVGDSTIANNGSWAYVMNKNYGSYKNLTKITTFSNNGRGGKNLSTYYTGGELRDRVLVNICPGDYVMIGDMGTNGMGSKFEESFNYYIDACEALGAKIILNSYSPHGAVGDYKSGYNAETQKFDSYRKDSYDNIVRSIYEERTTRGANEITYEDGKIKITSEKAQEGTLIIAEYEGDTLTSVKSEPITIEAGTKEIARELPEGSRVMVWNSLSGMKPLAQISSYDANIVGFVDIGKMADAAFNAYVDDFAANGYASRDAAAQAIITCFGDHNHYSNAPLAADLMVNGYGTGDDAKGIVKTLYEIVSADLSAGK